MERAVTLGAIFGQHALIAFDLMGLDSAVNGALKIWEWVQRKHHVNFTAREVFQALKGRFKRMAEVEGALIILLERGYVVELLPVILAESQPGRPPSPSYLVNPVLTEGWS